MPIKCAFLNCTTKRTDKKVLFGVPSDDYRRKQWEKIIGRKLKPRIMKVCELHFSESSIIRGKSHIGEHGVEIKLFRLPKLHMDALPKNLGNPAIKQLKKNKYLMKTININTPEYANILVENLPFKGVSREKTVSGNIFEAESKLEAQPESGNIFEAESKLEAQPEAQPEISNEIPISTIISKSDLKIMPDNHVFHKFLQSKTDSYNYMTKTVSESQTMYNNVLYEKLLIEKLTLPKFWHYITLNSNEVIYICNFALDLNDCLVPLKEIVISKSGPIFKCLGKLVNELFSTSIKTIIELEEVINEFEQICVERMEENQDCYFKDAVDNYNHNLVEGIEGGVGSKISIIVDDSLSKEAEQLEPNKNESGYKCNIEDESTYKAPSSKEALITSLTKSLEPYIQICEICGKISRHHTEAFRHKLLHRTPLKCEFCSKDFSTKTSLNNHIASIHNNETLLCSLCGFISKSKSNLTSHVLATHKPHNFKCSYCSSTFATKTILNNHIVKHTKERNFYCKTCGNKYLYRSGVIKCQNRHKGPHFICDHCGKDFFERQQLKSHKMIHPGPYPCAICQRTFLEADLERIHYRLCHINQNKKKPKEKTVEQPDKEIKNDELDEDLFDDEFQSVFIECE